VVERLELGAVIEAPARVIVERGPGGEVVSARFDLAGLPRVDSLLAGRPVVDLPPLIERLCGVCPVAHHLAGVRALEALAGIGGVGRLAADVRRLLHHGSVLAVHAMRFAVAGSGDTRPLRSLAKLAMTAAGSPGHFPVTAVVGGVARPVVPEDLARCRDALGAAQAAARRLVRACLAGPAAPQPFRGADLALTDDAGRPDLLGARLRAVAADGEVLVDGVESGQWDALVAEEYPGRPAPRPYLRLLGPERGLYRVGPCAQIRAGKLTSPEAAAWQDEWRAGGGGALGARAVMALHCVETIAQLVDRLGAAGEPGASDMAGAVEFAVAPSRFGGGNAAASGARVGVGWVDGARGLLVHRYEVTGEGVVKAAIVLTPTAQNEPWLAELLTRAVRGRPDGPGCATREAEEAIREVDPCLPCSAAPPGRMGLSIETVPCGAPMPSGGR
jgi:NAD-reducing hydrogenase large subunit